MDYGGLIEGLEYTLEGYAVNPETQNAIRDASGNVVTNTKDFVAGAESGSEDVVFAFEATNLAGQKIAFIEYLYYDVDVIAYHFDINDEAQSITFSPVTTTITSTPTSNTTSQTASKTADMRVVRILIVAAAAAAAECVAAIAENLGGTRR